MQHEEREVLDRRRFLRKVGLAGILASVTPVVLTITAKSAFADEPIICGHALEGSCVPLVVGADICSAFGQTCTAPLRINGGPGPTGRECVCA
ncbi:MAG TPA: twin-arginine translocation signal domain-containing protein [Actinomycetota bacterium]|jgi:hypothetical protein|nr:twin-arginine translocation signal domain-containing protein [Actinomycetota bacterium]